MTTIDLRPSSRQMATLVSGVDTSQLAAPTPCPAYTLGDLLDHVGGFALAFTGAATKSMTASTMSRSPWSAPYPVVSRPFPVDHGNTNAPDSMPNWR